ncbi:TIGR03663 family protein [Salinigranum rubrum]|uniref:TIGR03663 family protein n=1 Tax=Salinigranum rubrum TaxID=755307 RepID=A0A2I8VJR8_9EURY|nr:flippase activity-associated protein Agl23 [Salinigranum rubrum]AUV81309.1 TIGR03663 family protein [Salinigranum rubrum]
MRTDEGPLASKTFLALCGLSLLALLFRVVSLGGRVMHWDEGRVGYWILRYGETGVHSYRPIVHGPFLPIVNDYLFALLPASDFAARLPVAVVGGLFPLAAWLFRDHLDDDEVVALGALFALNPLLVYYSRFMRNDVLVAVFSVVAFGLLVRLLVTRRLGYLVGAGASMGLAFTTKENALLYVACFLGAGVLLLDHRLVRETRAGTRLSDVLAETWPTAVYRWVRDDEETFERGLARVGVYSLGALAAFFLVVVFFYAPRPDLWSALANPAALPGVVEAGTVAPAERLYGTWIDGGHQDNDYLTFLYGYLETFVYGAPVVLAFGLVGALLDRYSPANPGFRPLVAFAVYWGLASVVGYPLATDIEAPWAVIHAVVAFAIPASVGLAFVVRTGVDSLHDDDRVSTGLAALVLLAAIGGTLGANVAYWNSTEEADKQVLQWAQPSNDLRESIVDVRAVAETNDGTDVLFYGTTTPGGDSVELYVSNESSADTPPPGGPAWHSRLPLPWYLELSDAEVTSTAPDTPPEEALADAPPVVIAHDWDRDEIEPHLEGYTVREHAFKLWGEHIVVFVDEDALQRAEQRDPSL